jgi:uncharacterized alkaline shock family protein YloU
MSQEFTQPTRGKTTIASDVLLTIARLTTQNVKGVSRLAHGPNVGVNRLFKRAQIQEGVQIEIIEDLVYIDLYVILKNEINVRDVSRNIQNDVARAITEMVGMQVGSVNIHIEDIDYPPET